MLLSDRKKFRDLAAAPSGTCSPRFSFIPTLSLIVAVFALVISLQQSSIFEAQLTATERNTRFVDVLDKADSLCREIMPSASENILEVTRRWSNGDEYMSEHTADIDAKYLIYLTRRKTYFLSRLPILVNSLQKSVSSFLVFTNPADRDEARRIDPMFMMPFRRAAGLDVVDPDTLGGEFDWEKFALYSQLLCATAPRQLAKWYINHGPLDLFIKVKLYNTEVLDEEYAKRKGQRKLLNRLR